MISDYLETILRERDWSWTLIAILFIIIGLVVRAWFIRPLASKAKTLDRKIYHEIKGAYLQRSLAGWIFFFMAMGLAVFVWSRNPTPPLSLQDKAFLAGAFAAFFLSVIIHLIAFGLAGLSVLQNHTGENAKIL